jgi:hypothetical protein
MAWTRSRGLANEDKDSDRCAAKIYPESGSYKAGILQLWLSQNAMFPSTLRAGLPPQKEKQYALDAEPPRPAFSRESRGETVTDCGRHSIAHASAGPHGEFEVVKGQIPEEFLAGLKRDFTAEEKEEIYARCHKTIAPSLGPGNSPVALWVLGPSAVGKSFISAAKASSLFGSEYNGVILDGAEFRQVHAGFQAVAVHGMEHGLLHADCWSIFKSLGKEEGGQGISSALKQQIFQECLRDRQHLIIPDCGNQPERLYKMMQEVIDAGYHMHAVCLWAPLSETAARGEPRSVQEGKLWSGKDYEISTATCLLISRRWVKGLKEQPDVYKSLECWDK